MPGLLSCIRAGLVAREAATDSGQQKIQTTVTKGAIRKMKSIKLKHDRWSTETGEVK